jgi:hypothetical protein
VPKVERDDKKFARLISSDCFELFFSINFHVLDVLYAHPWILLLVTRAKIIFHVIFLLNNADIYMGSLHAKDDLNIKKGSIYC